MFDIGWTELLVIAIVLIVVVGPKDLPPMIRAFGKTMAGLRKMAGDFRAQFDEALKEADMDDVRQTISDVRNLNPTNSLRDAMNPLRELGHELRSDLQRAATPPSGPATSAPVDAPAVSLSDPEMTLPNTPPPSVATAPVAASGAAAAASSAPAAASVAPSTPGAEKPKRVRKAPVKTQQEIEAETVAAKPRRVAKTIAAKADAKKPKPATVSAIAAEPAISPAISKVAEKTAKPQAAKTAKTKTVSDSVVASAKAPARKAAGATTDPSVAPVKKTKTARPKKDEA